MLAQQRLPTLRRLRPGGRGYCTIAASLSRLAADEALLARTILCRRVIRRRRLRRGFEFCALWRRNNPEVDVNFARFCGATDREISGNCPNRSAQNSPEFCALAKPLGGGSSKVLASTHNPLYPTTGRFMAIAIFGGLNGTRSTYAIRPQCEQPGVEQRVVGQSNSENSGRASVGSPVVEAIRSHGRGLLPQLLHQLPARQSR
jgi:hypothetical protein